MVIPPSTEAVSTYSPDVEIRAAAPTPMQRHPLQP